MISPGEMVFPVVLFRAMRLLGRGCQRLVLGGALAAAPLLLGGCPVMSGAIQGTVSDEHVVAFVEDAEVYVTQRDGGICRYMATTDHDGECVLTEATDWTCNVTVSAEGSRTADRPR